MKNLGKIILFLLIFFSTTIYASVVARVEPPVVYSGETATYILTITGGKIQKPLLDNICGNEIVGTSSQTSIEMVNMDYKKSYILSYEFVPRKSCVIAPTEVTIDGKKEKSNEVKVVVKPASADKNAAFSLSLKASKKDVYVGEPFVINFELKQNRRAAVVDSKFIEPDFKGFWIKKKGDASREETPEYIITRVAYTIAAQREGNLTIKPAQLRIATRVNSRDMWGSFMPQIKWRSFYSNELHINAKPLPNNAKIVGDFTISAVADKKEITSNEAVNVTVTVKGDGNLEDIESFKPYIDGVNVFAEKIAIHGDTLTQKLAFVSDKDFTIPPFKLAFYNLKTKQVEQIKTKPIFIKVKGSAKADNRIYMQKGEDKGLVAQENSNKQDSVDKSASFNNIWLLVTFVFGFVLGIAVMFLKPFSWSKREKKFNIKDEKLLLVKLLPYKDIDEDVKKVIDILEKNQYGGEKKKLDRNLLKAIMKKYDIS